MRGDTGEGITGSVAPMLVALLASRSGSLARAETEKRMEIERLRIADLAGTGEADPDQKSALMTVAEIKTKEIDRPVMGEACRRGRCLKTAGVVA